MYECFKLDDGVVFIFIFIVEFWEFDNNDFIVEVLFVFWVNFNYYAYLSYDNYSADS